MYQDFVKSRGNVPRKELPRLALDDPQYSSTLVMLKKTRAEVEEYSSTLGVVNAIVDLPVTENVRRVIAKMFADPRNAEAISDAEYRKRDQMFQQSRERFGARMAEAVKKDKDALQSELSRMQEGNPAAT
jgi:hypothetical protein